MSVSDREKHEPQWTKIKSSNSGRQKYKTTAVMGAQHTAYIFRETFLSFEPRREHSLKTYILFIGCHSPIMQQSSETGISTGLGEQKFANSPGHNN